MSELILELVFCFLTSHKLAAVATIVLLLRVANGDPLIIVLFLRRVSGREAGGFLSTALLCSAWPGATALSDTI